MCPFWRKFTLGVSKLPFPCTKATRFGPLTIHAVFGSLPKISSLSHLPDSSVAGYIDANDVCLQDLLVLPDHLDHLEIHLVFHRSQICPSACDKLYQSVVHRAWVHFDTLQRQLRFQQVEPCIFSTRWVCPPKGHFLRKPKPQFCPLDSWWLDRWGLNWEVSQVS